MPDTNHAQCAPAAHSRDVGAQSEHQERARVTLTDGRRLVVMLCNHCRAPLFYCDTDGNYHHLGAGWPACFLVNEDSWELSTAGFSTEHGPAEPAADRCTYADDCPVHPGDASHGYR